jgi:hypothetical protein
VQQGDVELDGDVVGGGDLVGAGALGEERAGLDPLVLRVPVLQLLQPGADTRPLFGSA